jgi:hypothetical protein
MLEAFNAYCDASSIHGLSYLTPKNNIFIRLAWLIALPLVFSICSYMILTQVEETANNPVTSSIQSVPASRVPFPVLTFYNENHEASIETFFERLFNWLPFDCSKAKGKQAHECVNKAKKVRSHFKKEIDKVFAELFDKHMHFARNSTRDYIVKQKCQWTHEYYVDLLFYPLLMANLTSSDYNTLHAKFYNTARENFLLPTTQGERVKEMTKDIMEQFNVTQPTTKLDCSSILELSQQNGDKLIALVQTFLVFVSAKQVPLGTFLRSQIGSLTSTSYSFTDQHKEVKNLISSLVPLEGKGKHFFDLINYADFEWGTCFMNTHLIRNGPKYFFRSLHCQDWIDMKLQLLKNETEKEMFVKQLMLGIPPFYPHFASDVIEHLAQEGMKRLQLGNSLSKEEVLDSPSLWYCKTKSLTSNLCVDVQLSLTENGYGFSLNMGYWHNTVKTNILGLKAKPLERDHKVAPFNEQITMHIFNPEDK